MTDCNKSYGARRPQEIAAKVAALRAQLAPAILPAPALALVPAAPKQAAWVAPMQAERAEIRADLPMLRHYAARHDDGPTLAEIAALESRLADLDDALIFEADAAETFNVLPLAA